ncbi:MAG: helix-turn-helix transcriptional regulator [Lachnospiraceae bacterium]|jgi:DNA-binding transcriptional regulator YiaG|nr:helix-turn-helix transcriptional regulator [Lachnospiraceae bacterium]
MQLKEIRVSKKLSAPVLAELFGVSKRTIQHIEKRRDCIVSTAQELEVALELSLDVLCKKMT